MRVIVTGGAGFIGSNICDALLGGGHTVCVVDNLNERGGGRREHVPKDVRFDEVDIRDREQLDRVFSEFRPEVVCHQAAQTSVVRSSREPAYDASVNVLGTVNVLDAAVAIGARKCIFASTAATYGNVESLPATEETPQRPLSPYGMTKLIGEQYLTFYARQRGFEYTILRYGNVFGPRQNPQGEGGVVAIFTGRFVGKQPVQINSDGEQSRDFTYVGDVARVNVLALDRGANEAYVVGTGKKTTVNAIYKALVQITGFEAPVVAGPNRPGEARENYCDPAKADAQLGWRAEVDLISGLEKTLAYNAKVLAQVG